MEKSFVSAQRAGDGLCSRRTGYLTQPQSQWQSLRGGYVFLVSFYNLSSVSNSKPSSYQDSNSSLVTIMFLRLCLAAARLYIAIYSLRAMGIDCMNSILGAGTALALSL